MEIKTKKSTPMMEQWQQCKKEKPDAVLFFRMGDFYEAFYEDAKTLADELDLTLTKRQEIPMSGIPWTQLETYLDRMLAKGYKVAIAEQVEDPKQAKGLVKRKIVKTYTPGSVLSSSLLKEKENNFLCHIGQDGTSFAVVWTDITTPRIFAKRVQLEELCSLISQIMPSEILISKSIHDRIHESFSTLQLSVEFALFVKENTFFDFADPHLLSIFEKKLQQASDPLIRSTLHFLLKYLTEMHGSLTHMDHLIFANDHKMQLDSITMRNLEILKPIDRDRKSSLIYHLDQTKTPMGGRKLRSFLVEPLLDPQKIQARQDAVETFTKSPTLLKKAQSILASIRDLERLGVRICSDIASPRDLIALKTSIYKLPEIKMLLANQTSALLQQQIGAMKDLTIVAKWIEEAIVDEPPFRLSEGKTFRTGFDRKLDELYEFQKKSNRFLQDFQQKIQKDHGIKNLKVGYNKVFGYFIEVPKSQSKFMPEHFQRKQTLVNQERFTSEELSDYEQKMLLATERIAKIEKELFSALKEKISRFYKVLIEVSEALAVIDVIASFAEISLLDGLTRPLLQEDSCMEITAGKHLIVEKLSKEPFIPNDTIMDQNRMMIITGPNMGGKSTYIRQIALICLLAQIGCFVPVKRAKLPIVDQIFTRIGASDNLAGGQSTFMVEMHQSAHILKNLTPRSLLILDEIGRGTSTFDGIAIATSIMEYLATQKKPPLVFFATHFYELTKLEKQFPFIVNYHSQVQEKNQEITFLHKINKGSTDKSYGIHVAKLAGLPDRVIALAKQHLQNLENKPKSLEGQVQYLFSSQPPTDIEPILNIDLEKTTPLELMQKIEQFQKDHQ